MNEKKESQTPEEERELRQQKEDTKSAEDAPGDRGRAEQAANDKAGQPTMPKPTFSTFVLSFASSALVQLGEVPDPGTGKKSEDLLLAKHSIDTLAMLREKIDKGLDAEESRLLDGLIYELRMKYLVKK